MENKTGAEFLDDLIKSLDAHTKTASATLLDNLINENVEISTKPAVEEVSATTEVEKIASTTTEPKKSVQTTDFSVEEESKKTDVVEDTEKTAELEKIAEAEDKGRIMARAFFAELTKLAELENLEDAENEIENLEAEKLASSQEHILTQLYNFIHSN